MLPLPSDLDYHTCLGSHCYADNAARIRNVILLFHQLRLNVVTLVSYCQTFHLILSAPVIFALLIYVLCNYENLVGQKPGSDGTVLYCVRCGYRKSLSRKPIQHANETSCISPMLDVN